MSAARKTMPSVAPASETRIKVARLAAAEPAKGHELSPSHAAFVKGLRTYALMNGAPDLALATLYVETDDGAIFDYSRATTCAAMRTLAAAVEREIGSLAETDDAPPSMVEHSTGYLLAALATLSSGARHLRERASKAAACEPANAAPRRPATGSR